MYIRNIEEKIKQLMAEGHSALVFGPRQVGKTTSLKNCLINNKNTIEYLLQKPEVRMSFEQDPSLLIRQVEALPDNYYIYVDEAQKVPAIFDSMQYLLDEKKAKFLITGSSARKLRRKGANLLPGRVITLNLDPLSWNEFGWIESATIPELEMTNIGKINYYTIEKSMVFGSLPGIVSLQKDSEREEFLKAYSQIYLEEEIRAESLSRKLGAFSRFLELAASESGTSPNLSKLSMESGVSDPAIKSFFGLLEDTLIVQRVDPFLKNARKRILSSPKYYFFDIGVRNSVARLPLDADLINSQKGKLFEHAIILEILRRIHALNKNYKVCYWRTSGGAEVDCVIDLGQKVIPVEIKAGKKVALSELRGLINFLEDYPDLADCGYVITMAGKPEKLADNILAIPWNRL